MRAAHPHDAVLKAQGRDCYRCKGYGWDTWLPGDDDADRPWGNTFWNNCRDCKGTGKRVFT